MRLNNLLGNLQILVFSGSSSISLCLLEQSPRGFTARGIVCFLNIDKLIYAWASSEESGHLFEGGLTLGSIMIRAESFEAQNIYCSLDVN